MSAPRFYNRNGTLTPYSFMCGYVEKYGDGGAGSVWAEGDCYHVRGFLDDVRVWETFDRIVEARAFARKTFGRYQPARDAFSGI